MQSALDEAEHRLTEVQEVALRVKGLEEQLQLKTIELKEEMDDRDKAEDRVLRLTDCVTAKEKELESLRQEVMFYCFSQFINNHRRLICSTIDYGIKKIYYRCVSPDNGILHRRSREETT